MKFSQRIANVAKSNPKTGGEGSNNGIYDTSTKRAPERECLIKVCRHS